MRVGNEEYAKTNRSYGLTTLRNRHVKLEGSQPHCLSTSVASMAPSIISTCATSASHPSFGAVRNCRDRSCAEYLDDNGTPHALSSEDVNEYLRAIAGAEITAKDFRTWAATNLAALALRELESFDSQAKAKRNVVHAVEAVSKMLGNTPAIWRKCYIHPAVFDGYLDSSLLQALKNGRTQNWLTHEPA